MKTITDELDELPPKQLEDVDFNTFKEMVRRYLYDEAYSRRENKIEQLEKDIEDFQDVQRRIEAGESVWQNPKLEEDYKRQIQEYIEELKLNPDDLIESVFSDDDHCLYHWYKS